MGNVAGKMINRILLLRNTGQFDTVDACANVPFSRLTLIYAENSRGKTTLAAIFRSLATGDPVLIAERRRLSAQNPPHIILDCAGGPPDAMFLNNGWNRTLPNLVVFDDYFIDRNVYSGLSVGSDHRQNLHELILGARGVDLNHQLQQYVAQIENHNVSIRVRAEAIPAVARGPYSVDGFCVLPPDPEIDAKIQAAERALAASREQDPIRNTPAFDALNLPDLDLAGIEQSLQQDLPALDIAAAARVQAHLAGIGPAAETWVADGMRRLPGGRAEEIRGTCPFCAQDLVDSPVIAHYRAYFSEAYSGLKQRIAETIASVNRDHSGEATATFERAVRVVGERRQFWSRFCNVPDAQIDTESLAREWHDARESLLALLREKERAPLERMAVSEQASTAITAFRVRRELVAALSGQLQDVNVAINQVKREAAAADVTVLRDTLIRLRAVKARHAPQTAALCDRYLAEKAAKTNTERLRDQARVALDQYRVGIFPGFEIAINRYLDRFNAGIRLARVTSVNTRAGSTCTYDVIVNDTPVPVGGAPIVGLPSFRTTLSAGDRGALALALFLTTLDQDPAASNKIAVIDDPISSLDEHRSLTTVQEVRRLAQRTCQVIVLSHNKTFLGRIWQGADRVGRAALQVARDGAGSSILQWDVDQDCITEHDRRHAELREYLERPTPNNRGVASSIRPLLEAFLRVAYPGNFPPGFLLGQFRDLCTQRINTPREMLNLVDTEELRDLTEYANRFHHDTNPAWENEQINDGELTGYVRRALRFASKR